MKKRTISVVCGLLAPAATFWTLLPATATATGFDLPDQDAFVIGRGMAFVATADNPSAIYYNPAGLTQLKGDTLRAGLYGLYLDPGYKSPTTGLSYDNQNNWHALPQLYYAGRAEKVPLGYGIGFFAPFGLSSKWPQDTGFRTVATEGSLKYFTINPAVAYELLPNLSLGAGVTFNYAKTDLRQGLVWPAQPFDEFKFEGDGWDVGYNLGLLWKAHEKISLGLSFRSGTRVGMKGNTTVQNSVAFPPDSPVLPPLAVTQSAQADFPCPLKAIFGISYRPTPQWNFEFNADYTDWTSLDTITVKQAGPIPGILPQNVPLALNWEASWYYEFGATHYFDNGWTVSAGYIYNENSVPNANYTPLVADLDRHFLSLGVGHRGERFDFDVAYQFGYGPDRHVSGSALSATGQSADGKYDFLSHALAVSVSWHF
jgi:long-chain fatty acid transport protein